MNPKGYKPSAHKLACHFWSRRTTETG